MNAQGRLVAFNTIARREVMRILRIWTQTLLPSAITMTLYFVIFGRMVGSRIGDIEPGIGYIDYIVPGLIMMAVITNSYGNISSSFFGAKFQRFIEEMLASPTPPWVILPATSPARCCADSSSRSSCSRSHCSSRASICITRS
jgi:ABC-2 type transport system permease protein